ncbi:hypothetical protein HDU97_004327 [Phlyctochytrium planicorne]|nr:hypothetical protein HDU97_004327 [Phlyctochytrium planicorne]
MHAPEDSHMATFASPYNPGQRFGGRLSPFAIQSPMPSRLPRPPILSNEDHWEKAAGMAQHAEAIWKRRYRRIKEHEAEVYMFAELERQEANNVIEQLMFKEEEMSSRISELEHQLQLAKVEPRSRDLRRDEEQIEILKANETTLRIENEELKSMAAEQMTREKQREELAKQEADEQDMLIKQLMAREEDLTVKIAQLEKASTSAAEKLRDATAEFKAREDKQRDLIKELMMKDEDQLSRISQLEELLESQNANMEESAVRSRMGSESQRAEIEKLTLSEENLLAEIASVQNENQKLKDELCDFRSRETAQNDTIKELLASDESQCEKIAELEEENQKLAESLSNSLAQEKVQRENITELMAREAKMSAKISELLANEEELTTKVAHLEKQVKSQKARLEESVLQSKSGSESQNMVIRQLMLREDELSSKIVALERHLDAERKKFKELSSTARVQEETQTMVVEQAKEEELSTKIAQLGEQNESYEKAAKAAILRELEVRHAMQHIWTSLGSSITDLCQDKIQQQEQLDMLWDAAISNAEKSQLFASAGAQTDAQPEPTSQANASSEEKDAHIGSLKATIAELETRLSDMESKGSCLETLQETIKQLESKLHTAELLARSAVEAKEDVCLLNSDLSRANKALQALFDVQTEDAEGLRQRAKSVESEMIELRQQHARNLSELRVRMETLQFELDRMTLELVDEKRRSVEADESRSRLDGMCGELRDENERLRRELDEFEEANFELKRRLREVEGKVKAAAAGVAAEANAAASFEVERECKGCSDLGKIRLLNEVLMKDNEGLVHQIKQYQLREGGFGAS